LQRLPMALFAAWPLAVATSAGRSSAQLSANPICDKSASANKFAINIDIYLGICQYRTTIKQKSPAQSEKACGAIFGRPLVASVTNNFIIAKSH
jgi:hypothetical protein